MGLELVWIRGDGFAVVGGSGLIVAAGVLHIAKVEEGAGIARVLAQILLQQGAGAFEIMLVDSWLRPASPPAQACAPLPCRRLARCPGSWVPGGSWFCAWPLPAASIPASARKQTYLFSLITRPAPLAPPAQVPTNSRCGSRGSAPLAPGFPPPPPGLRRHPPRDPGRSPSQRT